MTIFSIKWFFWDFFFFSFSKTVKVNVEKEEDEVTFAWGPVANVARSKQARKTWQRLRKVAKDDGN